MSTKIPVTPAGIEPATFRFVAQHLNHCATAFPPTLMYPHQNNQLLVHDKRCFDAHWPAAFQFEILMTIFVELHVVAGSSRNCAGRPQAVSRRRMLIHTYHAAPLPCCAVALISCFQNGMVGARHGRGMDMTWYV